MARRSISRSSARRAIKKGRSSWRSPTNALAQDARGWTLDRSDSWANSRRAKTDFQTPNVRLFYNSFGAPRRGTISLDASGGSDCHLIVASFTPFTDVSRCVMSVPEKLDFGSVAIRQSTERTVTLHNNTTMSSRCPATGRSTSLMRRGRPSPPSVGVLQALRASPGSPSGPAIRSMFRRASTVLR